MANWDNTSEVVALEAGTGITITDNSGKALITNANSIKTRQVIVATTTTKGTSFTSTLAQLGYSPLVPTVVKVTMIGGGAGGGVGVSQVGSDLGLSGGGGGSGAAIIGLFKNLTATTPFTIGAGGVGGVGGTDTTIGSGDNILRAGGGKVPTTAAHGDAGAGGIASITDVNSLLSMGSFTSIQIDGTYGQATTDTDIQASGCGGNSIFGGAGGNKRDPAAFSNFDGKQGTGGGGGGRLMGNGNPAGAGGDGLIMLEFDA